ncbi:MAG: DUF445 family protein [Candidatus Dadabacteria bacterium]|nr:MAG: DUF445 family protein [Candidatus Dadabacteria bacterium]
MDFQNLLNAVIGIRPAFYLLPLIAALIGWFTNYLAVKMLFRPRKPVNLVFFTLQGVFPKRQQALARKIGEIVSSELFSVNDVKSKLKEHASSDQMIAVIMERIEKTITARLPQVIPLGETLITPLLTSQIRWLFIDDLKQMINDLVDSISDNLEETFDVHTVVEQKVAAFSTEKMEKLITTVMRREFKFIEAVGAVLGFVIGVIQVIIIELGD